MKQQDIQIGPQTDIRATAELKHTKRMVGLVLMLLLSVWVSTQHFAATFSYQKSLGASYEHVYWPWMIIVWGAKWFDQYQREFMFSGSLGVLAGGGFFMLILLHKLLTRHKVKAEEKMHGTARWANKKDLLDAGFFDNEGVYIGGWIDEKKKLHYLRHEGPEHVLCIAPTRSGKGVGLVIPTLLSWRGSAVITDLKGELWALTSGWRKEHGHNKVLRFEPASATSSVSFNPLDFIRLASENEVGDAQNLATLIVDPDGKGLQDHWQKTAQSLLVGCILHIIYKAKKEGFVASLPAIDDMLADPNRPIELLWEEMTTYAHWGGEVHPLVAASGRDMIDRPEQEGGSVLSTAKSYLSLYRDPVVRRNVERSDFSIKDLMHHDSAVSLYVVTQPNDKDRLKPLIRIVVNMVIRLLADKMDFENGRPVAHYKHRLLMMLDEFPSLGKLDIVQESLAFVAGYGIKCYLIVQDLSQLNAAYGRDESITGNCHVRSAYAPNRMDTAVALSAMTGETTIIKESITESGKRGSRLVNVSRNYQEVKRNLLTPDECLRLPGPRKDAAGGVLEAGDMLIFSAGRPAAYGKQILYFTDPTFSARAQVKAPAKSDRLYSKPVEPIHSVKPAAPVFALSEEPAEPMEPEEPVEPAEPMEPEEPVEPAEPMEPEEPVEPAEPMEPEEPIEPAQTTKAEEPEAEPGFFQ